MKLTRAVLSAAAFIGATLSSPATSAARRADLQVWRLDCGRITANDAAPFSDVGAFDGRRLQLADGCYLVRHGRDLLLWDAGVPSTLLHAATTTEPVSPTLAVDLPSQLAILGYKPTDVKWLALSHYHWDHAGQAGLFPGATLLIGDLDWKALKSSEAPYGADPTLVAHWVTGGGKLETVDGDRDVFGDWSVVILATPGHTPGSKSLLVRLGDGSSFILSGDAMVQEGGSERVGFPTWNTSRAESLASEARLRSLAATLHATIIVQHDVHDVDKLPRLPNAVR